VALVLIIPLVFLLYFIFFLNSLQDTKIFKRKDIMDEARGLYYYNIHYDTWFYPDPTPSSSSGTKDNVLT